MTKEAVILWKDPENEIHFQGFHFQCILNDYVFLVDIT